MSDPGRYAEVNGLRMYYEIHGEGPPLLPLHGGTCSIERPAMGIPFFSGEFTVIAPEQMGHGRTADHRGRAFHCHEMAEDTVELMRQLEIDRASVIGLSDGGMRESRPSVVRTSNSLTEEENPTHRPSSHARALLQWSGRATTSPAARARRTDSLCANRAFRRSFASR